MNDRAVRVLAVDDQDTNLRLIDAVLSPRGYDVVLCHSGAECLTHLAEDELVDLVLLDVLMPGIDGYEVCRRIRGERRTEFLPVVMITASGEQQRAKALEAGADDFVTKPFDQSELLARIASLARLKRYHDTITRQTEELAAWNEELTQRVEAQLEELARVGRLRRFLSPQVAELVMADEGLLQSHRREIVVVFFDLRNFSTFAETSEPEEVTALLGEFHTTLGRVIHRHEGTLERFTGDGAMVFFNDPVPCPDPADRAVATALAANIAVRVLAEGWHRRGFDLALGTGIAQGFATLGRIGFEDRFDYAAIGSVTNLAARMCDAAAPWQVLTTDRVLDSLTRPVTDAEPLGELNPKGFARPVRVNDISMSDVAR